MFLVISVLFLFFVYFFPPLRGWLLLLFAILNSCFDLPSAPQTLIQGFSSQYLLL